MPEFEVVFVRGLNDPVPVSGLKGYGLLSDILHEATLAARAEGYKVISIILSENDYKRLSEQVSRYNSSQYLIMMDATNTPNIAMLYGASVMIYSLQKSGNAQVQIVHEWET